MSSAGLSPHTSRMSEQIPGNRVSDRVSPHRRANDVQSVLATCERILQFKIPNLLRLYLNPYVTRTCVALNELVHAAWPATLPHGNFTSFLANSGEEALSGAIKLARYTLNARTRSGIARVFLIDDHETFSGFASTSVQGSDGIWTRIQFIPDVSELTTAEFLCLSATEGAVSRRCQQIANVVVIGPATSVSPTSELLSIVQQLQNDGCIVIIFAAGPQAAEAAVESPGFAPDIVVFDESFTNKSVPFGAFAARSDIYSQWTRRGMATFHSTTYQPNTISTMHFLKCLEESSPKFCNRIQSVLRPVHSDTQLLKKQFREFYNPSLGRLISGVDFDAGEILASRHYVRVGAKSYFDGIGGVACSLRGHNPGTWVSEIKALDAVTDCRAEVSTRLHELTGLRHHVPAVSGGSAVENALKLALIARHPASYVVVLKGGFGGKTLLALTGTARESYRKGLDPLYPDILYVDPFSIDAVEQLEALFKKYPVGVIQLELIQGVGGVRAIPETLVSICSRREWKPESCCSWMKSRQECFGPARSCDRQPSASCLTC
jgi:acetylornithine/succinyldiaminopimelate/putrescine aminotransferase